MICLRFFKHKEDLLLDMALKFNLEKMEKKFQDQEITRFKDNLKDSVPRAQQWVYLERYHFYLSKDIKFNDMFGGSLKVSFP
jgi:hypothetical protein